MPGVTPQPSHHSAVKCQQKPGSIITAVSPAPRLMSMAVVVGDFQPSLLEDSLCTVWWQQKPITPSNSAILAFEDVFFDASVVPVWIYNHSITWNKRRRLQVWILLVFLLSFTPCALIIMLLSPPANKCKWHILNRSCMGIILFFFCFFEGSVVMTTAIASCTKLGVFRICFKPVLRVLHLIICLRKSDLMMDSIFEIIPWPISESKIKLKITLMGST